MGLKHKDSSGNFVMPVTITNSSGSYVGNNGSYGFDYVDDAVAYSGS